MTFERFAAHYQIVPLDEQVLQRRKTALALFRAAFLKRQKKLEMARNKTAKKVGKSSPRKTSRVHNKKLKLVDYKDDLADNKRFGLKDDSKNPLLCMTSDKNQVLKIDFSPEEQVKKWRDEYSMKKPRFADFLESSSSEYDDSEKDPDWSDSPGSDDVVSEETDSQDFVEEASQELESMKEKSKDDDDDEREEGKITFSDSPTSPITAEARGEEQEQLCQVSPASSSISSDSNTIASNVPSFGSNISIRDLFDKFSDLEEETETSSEREEEDETDTSSEKSFLEAARETEEEDDFCSSQIMSQLDGHDEEINDDSLFPIGSLPDLPPPESILTPSNLMLVEKAGPWPAGSGPNVGRQESSMEPPIPAVRQGSTPTSVVIFNPRGKEVLFTCPY